jgi:hypothetical protein
MAEILAEFQTTKMQFDGVLAETATSSWVVPGERLKPLVELFHLVHEVRGAVEERSADPR